MASDPRPRCFQNAPSTMCKVRPQYGGDVEADLGPAAVLATQVGGGEAAQPELLTHVTASSGWPWVVRVRAFTSQMTRVPPRAQIKSTSPAAQRQFRSRTAYPCAR